MWCNCVGFVRLFAPLLFLKRWQFFAFVSLFYVLTMCCFAITDNGPRIGDSGGLKSRNFQFYTKLSNSLLLFSKFMKKGNIKGCCDKKRRNFQFLLYSAILPIRCYRQLLYLFFLFILKHFYKIK